MDLLLRIEKMLSEDFKDSEEFRQVRNELLDYIPSTNTTGKFLYMIENSCNKNVGFGISDYPFDAVRFIERECGFMVSRELFFEMPVDAGELRLLVLKRLQHCNYIGDWCGITFDSALGVVNGVIEGMG